MVKYLQDNPHYAEEVNDHSKLEQALETFARAGELDMEGRALRFLFRCITKLEIKDYMIYHIAKQQRTISSDEFPPTPNGVIVCIILLQQNQQQNQQHHHKLTSS